MGTIAFMAMESTGVTADPLDIVIRSETGSAISLPVIQPECFGYSQTYNVPFTVGGTSVAPTIVDAAPSEYGVSVTVAQRGYLPKSMSKRSWFRVYSSDTRPLTDGAFGITFRQKDASGNIISVLSGTVPKNGLSAIQCLAVCFQQIVPQMTETTLLPGASTGYTQDPPVVDGGGSFIRAGLHSEYLYLPHTAPDSVWEAVYTESADFLSRFSSPNYEPGWYGSGAGQSAAFTITITKVDNTGVYLLENTTWRMGDYPPIVASIQGNDLDAAADAIATIYRSASIPTGTVVISAPSAGQRSIAVAWPANASVTNGMHAPGGPSQFIKWKALKALSAGSGVSKLYGFRVTYGERVLDAAIPTLPWPTTSIPAGGGGGSSDALPADVIFAVNAESNASDLSQFGLSATASGTATIQASGSRTSDGYLRNTDGAQMADACFGYTPNAGFKAAWGAAQSMTLEFDIRVDTGAYFGGQILGIGGGYTALTSGGATGVSLSGSPFGVSAGYAELTSGQWHHIAFVADYNGGSRVIRVYRDGVEQGTGSSIGSFGFNDYPNPTTIGLLQLSAGFIGNGALKGGLDNIILTTRAKYNANFTPPGAVVGPTPISTSPLYLKFEDGAGNATALNQGTGGGAFPVTPHAIVSTQSRDGAGALQLTGVSGDSMGFSSITGPGTGNFTAEMWVRFASLGAGVAIFAGRFTFGLYVASDGRIGAFIGGSLESVTSTVTTNTWHHVALVRQAGTIHLYFNGVSVSPPLTGNTTNIASPLSLGEDGSYGVARAAFIDEYRFTNSALYTSNFTPESPLDDTPIIAPDNSIQCAGYNDIDGATGDGLFSVQATQPDANFSALVTLDDAVSGGVFTIDGQSANFNSARTISGATNTGKFTASVPVTFDGAAAVEDAAQVASFYSDVPIEFTGDSAIEDVGHISVYTFIAPAEFYSYTDEEDATNTTSLFALIDPVVYRLTATVPAATLVANTTQFYVDATVPAATLSAEISQYEGFKLSGTVPAATGRGWFGMRLNSDVPRVTIEAFGSVPNTLRMDKMLPRVTIDANIKDGRKFSLNANIPAATLSAWTGWQLAGMVPVATASGNIVVGGAFKLNSEVPVATGFGVISTMNVLRLNAVVPVATRGNWLALSCNVPAARLLARISAVQAITRVAYSFTLANSAMTRYPAYPFVQIIRMGNAYYGVADDGLYEIGGETDNGTSIPWSWETCMTDFGKAEKKTVVSAYLGGYVPQSMTYTIKAGDVPTGANAHTTTATAVLRNHRQKFGIGRKSRFFAFGLSATQGRVAIESIEFEVANMSRRV